MPSASATAHMEKKNHARDSLGTRPTPPRVPMIPRAPETIGARGESLTRMSPSPPSEGADPLPIRRAWPSFAPSQP